MSEIFAGSVIGSLTAARYIFTSVSISNRWKGFRLGSYQSRPVFIDFRFCFGSSSSPG